MISDRASNCNILAGHHQALDGLSLLVRAHRGHNGRLEFLNVSCSGDFRPWTVEGCSLADASSARSRTSEPWQACLMECCQGVAAAFRSQQNQGCSIAGSLSSVIEGWPPVH